MATTSDRAAVNRRIVLFSALLAGAILVGVVLFFLFVGRVDPLVQSALLTTTATAT
ncbi:MAG: hypothetical protein JSW71_09815 [Gemmatimonadota bacterium]|nr:MAG: hypothetical protein JSW71_09815 [Gemmatimonadota bacterium]